MLNTALVVALGGGLSSQVSLVLTYPDQDNILRGADSTPQIELVLDSSCSMSAGWGCFASVCTDYYNNNVFGGLTGRDCNTAVTLSKNDQIKAALTGCNNANDGILDKWDQKVLFSIRQFGTSVTGVAEELGGIPGTIRMLAEFTQNHATLETAIDNLDNNGGTPMASAVVASGQHMNAHFNNGNTAQCRQNFQVVMTDGEGNGGPRTASWVVGKNPITISDSFSGGQPWSDALAAYMFDGVHSGGLVTPPGTAGVELDALNNVTGIQPIRTYSLAFQAPAAAQALLSNMATEGDGAYYNANTYAQLDQAFTDIITSIVARSNITFSGNSIQSDGIFSGNYVYTNAVKPVGSSFWLGTVRKYCVLPDAACPAGGSVFIYNASNQLITNPAAQDLWTGFNSQDATTGGTGYQTWASIMGVTQQADPVPANPLGLRTILTWKRGGANYIPVDGSLNPSDTWTSGNCEHYSLLNKLHGYIYDVVDCAGGNFAPSALEQWPQSDSLNAGTALLKYGADCESTGNCYVATVSNAGMLHFFDTGNGVEQSAIIPADLWEPNQVAHSTLSQVEDQPNLDSARRYYFDGEIRVFHDDNGGGNANLAGNGIIDTGEDAHLIVGLGRAGAAFYSFPMQTFNGVPTAANNPPRPLYPDSSTGYQFLRDTWAAPWLGRFRYNGSDNAVAVFASGHRRDQDAPTASLIGTGGGLGGQLIDSKAAPQNDPCLTAQGDPDWIGVTPNVCDPLSGTALTPIACATPQTTNPFCALTFSCCYDWIGWQAILGPAVPWTWKVGGGAQFLYGPIRWDKPTNQQDAVSYRVIFDDVWLQPGDYIAILDSSLNEAGRLDGAAFLGGEDTVYTPWVDDTSFYILIETNGIDDRAATFPPFKVKELEYVRRIKATPGATTSPTVYVVDVNRWNGPNTDGSGGQGFADIPPAGGGGPDRQADALLARFTSTCVGTTGPNETCVDQSTNGLTSDLQYMVCGISSELSVYTEGDLLRAVYWMDRCGQIFKVDYNPNNPADPWSASRLLSTNDPGAAAGASKDYRQGFAQLELVLSQCNGSRAIGVYFGTGNLQRPAAPDNLQSAALAVHGNGDVSYTAVAPAVGNQYADVMGVVWDSPSLLNGATLANLVNVTTTPSILTPAGTNGFFIHLLRNEHMLRKPVVLDGVAFFKTYQMTTPATECISADGLDRFYVFNSCNAKALVDGSDGGSVIGDSASDRIAYAAQTDIGGDIFVFTPKGQKPIVSALDLNNSVTAELPTNTKTRPVRLLLWKSKLD